MRPERILPHTTIVVSAMCLVLFVLDRFNMYMHFMLNDITKWLVAVLCILSVLTSMLCIGGFLRADEHRARAEHERLKKMKQEEKNTDHRHWERIG